MIGEIAHQGARNIRHNRLGCNILHRSMGRCSLSPLTSYHVPSKDITNSGSPHHYLTCLCSSLRNLSLQAEHFPFLGRRIPVVPGANTISRLWNARWIYVLGDPSHFL